MNQKSKDSSFNVARFKIIGPLERDSKFLHNNSKNAWTLIKKSSEDIKESLRKFHNRFISKSIDF